MHKKDTINRPPSADDFQKQRKKNIKRHQPLKPKPRNGVAIKRRRHSNGEAKLKREPTISLLRTYWSHGKTETTTTSIDKTTFQRKIKSPCTIRTICTK